MRDLSRALHPKERVGIFFIDIRSSNDWPCPPMWPSGIATRFGLVLVGLAGRGVDWMYGLSTCGERLVIAVTNHDIALLRSGSRGLSIPSNTGNNRSVLGRMIGSSI